MSVQNNNFLIYWKFIVLVKGQEVKAPFDLRKEKSKKIPFTKQDAINYLLATVFKPKN